MTQARIDQLTEHTAGMLQALSRADPHAARLLPALWQVLGEGRPATVEEVAATADLPAAAVAERLQADQQAELDRNGRMLGFGLTLLPTGHRIDLAGRAHPLYGWCAPDVLVVPWLLGVPGRVSSRCPSTGTAITAHVGPEGVGEVEPAGAVVSFVAALDAADIRAGTCDRQHLFASHQAAAGWLAEHPHGTVVPVAEAFQAMTRAFGDAGWTQAHAWPERARRPAEPRLRKDRVVRAGGSSGGPIQLDQRRKEATVNKPTARQQAGGSGATRVWRTGPVSRLYRLGLAVLLGLSAYTLIVAGHGGFSRPDSAQEPGVWILTGFALFAVRDAAATVVGPRWGRRALAGTVALMAAAAAAALAADGPLWAPPLTWLLYGLDLTFAIAIGTAMVVSIVVGTPGCELGAVRELVLRLQGSFDPRQVEAQACGAGFHRVDRWEARRPWRARP